MRDTPKPGRTTSKKPPRGKASEPTPKPTKPPGAKESPTKMPTRRPRAPKSAINVVLARAAQADAKRKRHAKSLVARIVRLRTRIAEDFYELALCFHELRTERYWATLGYDSFEACITGEKLFDVEGARQMADIIDAKVGRDAALALGSYSAVYAAVQLTKATKAPDTVDGLVESDARVGGVRVVGSNVRELRAARLAVRAAEGTTKPARRASAEVRHARAAAAALGRALSKGARVDAEVRARETDPPTVVVTLGVDAADAVAERLIKRRSSAERLASRTIGNAGSSKSSRAGARLAGARRRRGPRVRRVPTMVGRRGIDRARCGPHQVQP